MHRRQFAAGFDADVLLFEMAHEFLDGVRILKRQDLRRQLDDGHLGAKTPIEGGKLSPDDTTADDTQGLWHRFEREDIVRVDDRFAVGLGKWQVADARASRENHGFGRQGGDFAIVGGDADLALARQTTVALIHFDLVFFHQKPQALALSIDDALLAREDPLPVVGYLADVEPEVAGMLQLGVGFSRLEQRLGGNTAPIQAGAAEVRCFFDEGGFEPELRGADGGNFAPGAGTDDDQVEANCSGHKNSWCHDLGDGACMTMASL